MNTLKEETKEPSKAGMLGVRVTEVRNVAVVGRGKVGVLSTAWPEPGATHGCLLEVESSPNSLKLP